MPQEDKPSNGYRKVYKMRKAGDDGLNIIVSIPKPVVEKAARERGLSISQFLEKYRAVATYDGFEGVMYTFQPAENVDA